MGFVCCYTYLAHLLCCCVGVEDGYRFICGKMQKGDGKPKLAAEKDMCAPVTGRKTMDNTSKTNITLVTIFLATCVSVQISPRCRSFKGYSAVRTDWGRHPISPLPCPCYYSTVRVYRSRQQNPEGCGSEPSMTSVPENPWCRRRLRRVNSLGIDLTNYGAYQVMHLASWRNGERLPRISLRPLPWHISRTLSQHHGPGF
jgi:hypothetical protein